MEKNELEMKGNWTTAMDENEQCGCEMKGKATCIDLGMESSPGTCSCTQTLIHICLKCPEYVADHFIICDNVLLCLYEGM